MATRNLVINDPVGIHARPAAQFAQAVTASNCNVTIAKEGGDAVPACSTGGCSILERSRRSRMATGIARRIANRTA